MRRSMTLPFPRILPAAVSTAAFMAGMLAPATALADEAKPGCTYVDVADVPIRYASPSLMPAVDGAIDGAPATMLVDTGSFETLITMNGALRRDLSLYMTGRYVEGFGGDSRLYTARLKDFTIGPSHATRRVDLYVVGEDKVPPVVDAIVGAPFLLQTDLEVDLRAKQLRFFRQRDCQKTPLMLWKEPTVVVPFEHSPDRSPNPHFTVTVDGKELDAIIDTGAHNSLITLEAARRVGIDVKDPSVRRLGSSGGIGSGRAPHWATRVKTVQIGDETIRDAEISIVDPQGRTGAELFLGQDFLRAHRVLFAMSQRKLYFAYLGGDAFTRSDGMPDWMRAEAESGNPDAEYVLASAYNSGNGVPHDPAQAQAWLHKAAAAGQPNANLSIGRAQMLAGHVADAIPKLRAGLDQLPADRLAPLWLYLARVRNGEAELARTELEASLKKQKDDDWPQPVAGFYLGKLEAAHLLDAAAKGKDAELAHARTCMADAYMAEWHRAHGQQAQADALTATHQAQCAPPAAPAARPTNKAAP
jgi:predicted aspartyl protease